MEALIVIGLVVVAIVIFDLLAVTHGVDSRPGLGTSRVPDRIFPV
jgi:hypothetical protein